MSEEKLKAYRQKRSFDKTAEPYGEGGKKAAAGLCYAVQHHIASCDHYDLRLEWGGVLLSWAVPKGPSLDVKDKRLAVRVEDHPFDYRAFEGVIPEGEYGGGTVMLWDEGYWSPMSESVEKALKQGSLKFELHGKRLKGRWALVRFADGGKQDNWLLIKEKDGYAKEQSGIAEFKTSIKTGRTMQEIAKNAPLKEQDGAKNPFDKIDVQLASLESVLPSGGKWLYELKFDGYRIVAFIQGGSVRLVSRNGGDYTKSFGTVADALIKWAGSRAIVLDGEMVIADSEGKSDFQAMQNYIKGQKGKPPAYMIFDLPAYEGVDLRDTPLIARKKKLKALIKNAPAPLHYSEHTEDIGQAELKSICASGYEGIIAKRADSVYSGKRNGDWIKLKCGLGQEFVIIGYTLTQKKMGGLSALLLGYYEDGGLIYAGKAGTGFSEAERSELAQKFKKLIVKNPPLKDAPAAKNGEQIFWLSPKLAAEIRFAGWTHDSLLRQASFKGLRQDKEPQGIVKEKPSNKVKISADKKQGENTAVLGVTLSNPDKLMFTAPKITKRRLADYYNEVSDRMLPFVAGRILSLVCCPKGVTSDCYYKKHEHEQLDGLVKMPVGGKDGGEKDYFYIAKPSGLISLVQQNTVEFHIWGSQAKNKEKPDMMVFDLDPDEGMDLKTVRRGVKDLKSVLDGLSLKSYLKTSGGKGYHVVVPFSGVSGWEAFSGFAKSIAVFMEGKWPDRYTSNMRKEKRKGRIFIDWMRNGRGATGVAPYSVRARSGAKVSMPISWSELDKVAPDGVDMPAALKRLKANDPWEDFFDAKKTQRLKKAMKI